MPGRAESIIREVMASTAPPALRLQPPAAGEHTDPILAASGYSAERIAALRRANAVN